MVVFKVDEVHDQGLDWAILRDGGVCLYWRQEILADEVNWLKSKGYKIISFEAAEWQSASEWKSERRMHESLKAQLSFPDYYGKNLNALDECVLDDLVVPDSGGLAPVLNHYDRFFKPVHNLASDKRSTAEVAAYRPLRRASSASLLRKSICAEHPINGILSKFAARRPLCRQVTELWRCYRRFSLLSLFQ
ncbi:MAG: barstar family protein [Silvibacterium sp.]|jgi:hypothetical protein